MTFLPLFTPQSAVFFLCRLSKDSNISGGRDPLYYEEWGWHVLNIEYFFLK